MACCNDDLSSIMAYCNADLSSIMAYCNADLSSIMACCNDDFIETETSDGDVFSWEEIELAYREEFGTVEFWTDDVNIYMLQCIVDTKFSIHPGYEYEVDCQQFSTPRLVVYCLLCPNVELKSYHHFMSHHKGKAHAKNVVWQEYPPTKTEMAKLRVRIEEREGRIHHSISELSYQLPMSLRIDTHDLATSNLSLTSICTCETGSDYTSESEAEESCISMDYQDRDHTNDHWLSADEKIIIKDLKNHSLRLENFYAKKKDMRDIAKLMHRVSKLLDNLKVD